MSEETGRGSSAPEANGAGIVDPTAVALALEGASRVKADAFLDDQRSLIAAQLRHLHEQLTQIHLDIFEKWLGMLLRLATLCVGVAAAAGLGLMVWDAAHADGLVIEEFPVPADMAARGLTGQVVATQMLDKLTRMQNLTKSNRAPRSYADNWGTDLKVEIPETGVSIGEAYRFLRGWLGHETHISGELFHTESGIAITARIAGDSGATFTGTENELDGLEEKAAEQIYSTSQPYRYGVYLTDENRHDESIAQFQALTRTGSPSERAWGYSGLGVGLGQSTHGGSLNEQADMFRRGLELDPTNALLVGNLAIAEVNLGQAEQSLNHNRKTLVLLASPGQGQVRADYAPVYRGGIQAGIDELLGDFSHAAVGTSNYIMTGTNTSGGGTGRLAQHQARAHDLAAARVTVANPAPGPRGRAEGDSFQTRAAQIEIAVMAQDWNDVVRQVSLAQSLAAASPFLQSVYHMVVGPNVALAEAKLGHIAAAEAQLADTPMDCYQCLRARAWIAETKGDHGTADAWFGQAVRAAPSIPMAYSEWGVALLDRGQPDAAIVQFKLANQKGPNFADPLEGWGEALMAKNRSDLALAKFEEAGKHTPNWGRLHLKWGEALYYAGRKDEAAAQFARAAGLDLTPGEKEELARAAKSETKTAAG